MNKNYKLIRTKTFESPFLDDKAIFTLKLFDTFRRDSYGKNRLAYEFFQDKKLIFTGNDFFCSPLHSIDSDDSIYSLMGFLTLCPGDTDEEYFKDYTSCQFEFCDQYAESLSILVYDFEEN